MADENDIQAGTGKTPPYVAFRTFLTLLDDFRAHGMPPQIDSSVLKRFSGSAGAQLVQALKYLGYVDNQKKCLPLFKEAVDSYKTDQFPEHLKRVLIAAYPFLAELNLLTATPGMFSEAFRKNFSAKEDVQRKSRTFYIHAATAAGVELGPRLKTGGSSSAPSSTAPRKRSAKAKTKADEIEEEDESEVSRRKPPIDPDRAEKPLEYQLIDLMKEPDIDQPVKESIWALVQYLSMRKAKADQKKHG